jgi:hypothetical protein
LYLIGLYDHGGDPLTVLDVEALSDLACKGLPYLIGLYDHGGDALTALDVEALPDAAREAVPHHQAALVTTPGPHLYTHNRRYR